MTTKTWDQTFVSLPIQLFPVLVTYYDSMSREILHEIYLVGPAAITVPALFGVAHPLITVRATFGDGSMEEMQAKYAE